jgi:hypothetical protein
MKQPSAAVKYGLFAVLATAVNIALQRALGALLQGPCCIYLAILTGTAGGLAVKYCLDRRFVFRYRPPSRPDETLRVLLYLGHERLRHRRVLGRGAVLLGPIQLPRSQVRRRGAGARPGLRFEIRAGPALRFSRM